MEIDDEIIARQITLQRFTAGERGRVLVILKQLEEELIELLFYSGKKLTDIGRADKARLLKQAQDIIASYYGEVSDSVGRNLATLGQVEATATAATLGEAFQGAIVPSLPAEAVFRRLVDNTLIDGAPSADWWKRQAADVTFRFRNAVQQGLAQAEANDAIIRRVRGPAGVMQVARNNAAALVQTSVQTVANAARMDTFEANLDIIKGYRQLSTLDGHTTLDCVAYSGAAWDAQKKPTGTTVLPFVSPRGASSGTPRHWNCRSLITVITKTFKELGLDIPEPPSSTRSASGGPVSAKLEFDAFLKRRGAKFTDELLGPGRADLWRDGKITLQQLLDQNGRPLTLAQLRKLYG